MKILVLVLVLVLLLFIHAGKWCDICMVRDFHKADYSGGELWGAEGSRSF